MNKNFLFFLVPLVCNFICTIINPPRGDATGYLFTLPIGGLIALIGWGITFRKFESVSSSSLGKFISTHSHLGIILGVSLALVVLALIQFFSFGIFRLLYYVCLIVIVIFITRRVNVPEALILLCPIIIVVISSFFHGVLFYYTPRDGYQLGPEKIFWAFFTFLEYMAMFPIDAAIAWVAWRMGFIKLETNLISH